MKEQYVMTEKNSSKKVLLLIQKHLFSGKNTKIFEHSELKK